MQSSTAEIGLRKASRSALAVRWVVSAHLALLLVQFVAAIMAAAGMIAVFQVHTANARLVAVSSILQALGVLSAGSARAGWFVRSMSVAVALGACTQLYVGLGGGVPLHVTLAMVLWGLSIAIFIRVWQPGWAT
jgi:hypothetical protein